MSLCDSNKDACSLKAALDEVDELTLKTGAEIDRTLKKIELEVSDYNKNSTVWIILLSTRMAVCCKKTRESMVGLTGMV